MCLVLCADIDELLELAADMKARIDQLSRKLVSALKRKNKSEQKVAANCELITATLQAFSEKRRKPVLTASYIFKCFGPGLLPVLASAKWHGTAPILK